jgi:RNA polymerase sigma-70 factor (family 1)
MAGDDQAAFTSLYRRHWESLFVTTVRVIGNKEDAEDIIQEVFASLWNRRKALNLTGPLAGYLHASVKYKAINYIERNITRRHYLDVLSKAAGTGAPISPEVVLRVKEMQQLIQTVIGKMPPKMREVYQLSRQEHLTHREIAARLAISEETVKKHIQNALQLLRSAMGKASASIPALLFYLLS